MLPQARPVPLHVLLQRTPEDVFEPDFASDVPLVQFVAFGSHDRLFGWVRLRADRLTDLLNAHAELVLSNVDIEPLHGGATRSVDELLIQRSEVIAVLASGPRGDESRRRLTLAHPVAVQSGSFLIGGYLHAPPGSDPLASVGERLPMVPLTDAWIERWAGDRCTMRSSGTIIVNRARIDRMRVITDEVLYGGQLRPVTTEVCGTS